MMLIKKVRMNDTMSHELTEQELVRREKMESLKEKGIDPFSSGFKPDIHSKDLLDQYGDKTKEELSELNIPAKVDKRETIASLFIKEKYYISKLSVKEKYVSCIFKIEMDKSKFIYEKMQLVMTCLSISPI